MLLVVPMQHGQLNLIIHFGHVEEMVMGSSLSNRGKEGLEMQEAA